jgi:hypothetical protein
MTDIAEPPVRDQALASVSALCIAAFDPGLSGAVAFYYPQHIAAEKFPGGGQAASREGTPPGAQPGLINGASSIRSRKHDR